jgi:hypothetical protein
LDGELAQCKASTYTGQHKHRKTGHISTPHVGFKPMMPVFEHPKTVHALDCTALGTGRFVVQQNEFSDRLDDF